MKCYATPKRGRAALSPVQERVSSPGIAKRWRVRVTSSGSSVVAQARSWRASPRELEAAMRLVIRER